MAVFHQQHLRSAIDIIEAYQFNEPFSVFLKNHFRKHKKFGSKDRKNIADLCFGYFRIGQSAITYPIQDQIIIGFYLTHLSDNGFLQFTNPNLCRSIDAAIEEKPAFLQKQFPAFDASKIFVFRSDLTGAIDASAFNFSHLIKPLVYINIRHQTQSHITKQLSLQEVPHVSEGGFIGFEQQIDLTKWFDVDRDVVVQDISSQKTIGLLKDYLLNADSVWDACAGSGGKSILAADAFHFKHHFVSDIRENILEELSRRMALAKVPIQQAFCVDLSNSLSVQVAKQYLPSDGLDLIIADVPCTGSGTWGRSSEWLRSFDPETIELYHQRQVKIVENLLPFINEHGYLLYITCSVFAKENEAVLEVLAAKHPVNILKQQYFIGYPQRGDQLFAALITL
jgi:16S rRNA (cytosine967-C5)-methyltransferase